MVRCCRPTARFCPKDGDLPEHVTLAIARPPGFEHLEREAWYTLLAERASAVEAKTANQRRAEGRSILGRAAVLRQRPSDRPFSHEPRRGLSPRVASVNKRARIAAIRRDTVFIAAYRAARVPCQTSADAIFLVGTYWLRRFASVAVEVNTA